MAADIWGGIPTPPWDGLNTTGVFKGLHLPPEEMLVPSSAPALASFV